MRLHLRSESRSATDRLPRSNAGLFDLPTANGAGYPVEPSGRQDTWPGQHTRAFERPASQRQPGDACSGRWRRSLGCDGLRTSLSLDDCNASRDTMQATTLVDDMQVEAGRRSGPEPSRSGDRRAPGRRARAYRDVFTACPQGLEGSGPLAPCTCLTTPSRLAQARIRTPCGSTSAPSLRSAARRSPISSTANPLLSPATALSTYPSAIDLPVVWP